MKKSRIALAFVAGASLIFAACGGDDGGSVATEAPTASEAPASSEAPVTDAPEAPTASDVGITADTIKIGVAVSDLEAIRAMGITIPETLTTDHLFKRWTVFFDKWNAAGGINGRQVEAVQLVWNPLDPSTFDTLCAAATVDNELFMVINGTGLSSTARKCLLDAGMPIMYGDVMGQAELDTGLAISLAAPSETVAEAGVTAWMDSTDAAPGSVVGVLSNNTVTGSAAGKAAEAALTAGGFTPKLIEINSTQGDSAATNEEGAAAVAVFEAEGAVQTFVSTPFTETQGFWGAAAAAGLKFSLLDTSSSGCSAFGLSRAPAAAVGSDCVTAYDHATDGTSIRPDTEFEAACRSFFDESFSDYYGGPSNPGVPAGNVYTDVNGKTLISDYTPQECALANIMNLGLTAAGVNPTRQSYIDAVLNLGEVPLALAGGGTGKFAPGKPFAANALHTVRITAAAIDTAPDANGLYNGCAAPVNCGVVVGDWTPIS
ncbi:MAG: hypothetical protein WCK23_10340 [Actinomycetes bacterium]